MTKPTLVVDLDGTLIRNDLTFELLALSARWNPFLFLCALVKALTDRAGAKRLLAIRFGRFVNPVELPYQPEILALVESYKQQGHQVELVSGSDESLVRRIGHYLGIDFCKGSTPGINLTAARKAEFLKARHGGEFIYAGNSKADFAVWRAGQGGYAINAPNRSYHLKRADGSAVQVEKLAYRRSEIPALIEGLRLHQWAKNLLIFVVPAIQITHLRPIDFLLLISAFLCFSCLASATYLINDLFDIQDDRQHRSKASRPLASGRLSVVFALWFVALVIPAAVCIAFLISAAFGWACLAYLAVTLAYSLGVKRVAVADVCTLAGLFSARVVAGAFVVNYPPSGWLLTFIGCFFLSLAIGKRFIEVRSLDPNTSVAGRGYVAGDSVPLLAVGSAMGAVAVLAMLMYGMSSSVSVFRSETVVLIGSAFLLAWVLRFWLLAGRGEVTDDPVIYAVKDKASLSLLMITACTFAYDLTGPLWQNAL
ncbi:MAG: UbiA family prenyltransferase [Pseudomonadota bacterium]